MTDAIIKNLESDIKEVERHLAATIALNDLLVTEALLKHLKGKAEDIEQIGLIQEEIRRQ